MIRVLIADDDTMALSGIERIIESAEDITVAGATIIYKDVLEKISELRPDVVILDMVWGSDRLMGMRLITEIKERYPDSAIVVLSAFLLHLEQAAEADVVTLSKGTRSVDILTAIRLACTRKEPLEAIDQEQGKPLTTRQKEVLGLMANGLTNKEIALDLGISVSSVSQHVANILENLGVRSRIEAVVKGIELHMI